MLKLFAILFVFWSFPTFSAELNWTQSPSAHERELKKRYNNTLYKPMRRFVSQEDINDAIQKDKRSSEKVNTEISLFIKNVQLASSSGSIKKL